jgi:hypothetical protein
MIGDVAVYGMHYLSEKYIALLKIMLNMNDFKGKDIVNTIVFGENQPIRTEDGHPLYACYKALTDGHKIVGVNLQHHFNSAESTARMDDGFISIRAYIWYNMITSILHEMYHGVFIAGEIEQDIPDLEETCCKMAEEALVVLAKKYEIEPEAMCLEPFFGPRYMELFVREIKDSVDDWAKRHKAMHDEVNVHYDDKDNEFIRTFQTFIRFSLASDGDFAEDWDFEPEALVLGAPNTPDTVHPIIMEALTTAEPVAEVPLPWQEQGEAIIPAGVAGEAIIPAGVAVVQNTVSQDMDEYADTMLNIKDDGDDHGAYTVSGYDMLPAAVETVQQVPVIQQTLMAFCTNCGTQLATGMKFCGGCGTAATGPVAVQSIPAQPLPVQAVPLVSETGPVQAPANQYPGGRGTYNQVLRTDLPNHNFTPEKIRSMMEQLMHTLYAHIFNKCGYRVMASPAFDDAQKWAILEPVNVSDIPDMDKFLIAADVHDVSTNDTKKKVPVENGMVSGKCTKKGGWPSYTLYLNCNGLEIKRIILPQNPWKLDDAGAYSRPAKDAQAGATIAWIMDGDDNCKGKKFRAEIRNSVFNWYI